MKPNQGKHEAGLPSARGVRRACRNELYRTAKRLRLWIPPEKQREAEDLYFRRVALNLPWIFEHRSDRRKLADWWDENVAGDIAALWGTDRQKLTEAFRDAFGG